MRVTILLMLQLQDEPLNDIDVLAVLRAIGGAYIMYRSDPFVSLALQGAPVSPDTNLADRQIRSTAFDRRIAELAGWTGD